MSQIRVLFLKRREETHEVPSCDNFAPRTEASSEGRVVVVHARVDDRNLTSERSSPSDRSKREK